MRAQGLISDGEFLAEKAGLSRKQASVEIAAGDDSLSVRRIEADLDRVVAPLSDMPATWEGLPVAEKCWFQHYVLPVGFTAGGIGTAELGLLFRVLRQFREGNSHEVPLTSGSWN